jgi:hypothetical protein
MHKKTKRKQRMKVVRLKNGTEESEALVNLVMKIIRVMFNLDPSLVYSLHRLCQGNYNEQKNFLSYYFIGHFKKYGLLDDKENMHPSIMNIIISAVKLSGSDVIISSPSID